MAKRDKVRGHCVQNRLRRVRTVTEGSSEDRIHAGLMWGKKKPLLILRDNQKQTKKEPLNSEYVSIPKNARCLYQCHKAAH